MPHENFMRKSAHELLELPLRQWTTEIICMWFEHLGLFMYVSEARKCLRSGSQLLDMNSYDLEMKMNIKSGLHRKKLLLALDARRRRDAGEETSLISTNLEKLDHQWVVRYVKLK